MPKKKPLQDNTTAFFTFFNEVGIIAQLSRAVLEAHLPDGVSASQFSILNHLIRVSDGRTPLELAKAFQVPKTTMTSTLSGATRSHRNAAQSFGSQIEASLVDQFRTTVSRTGYQALGARCGSFCDQSRRKQDR
jgi:hypothetical protein